MHSMDAQEFSFEVNNRRVAKRYPMNLPLTFNGCSGVSINISVTGMRFVTSTPVNLGDQAKFHVQFAGESVELVAETVWSSRQGPGSVVGAVFKPGSQLSQLSRCLTRKPKTPAREVPWRPVTA